MTDGACALNSESVGVALILGLPARVPSPSLTQECQWRESRKRPVTVVLAFDCSLPNFPGLRPGLGKPPTLWAGFQEMWLPGCVRGRARNRLSSHKNQLPHLSRFFMSRFFCQIRPRLNNKKGMPCTGPRTDLHRCRDPTLPLFDPKRKSQRPCPVVLPDIPQGP